MSNRGLRHIEGAKRNALAQVTYESEPVAGIDLYNSVRAGLLVQRLSFNAYCEQVKVDRSYAYNCLVGRSNGPAAKALRKKFLDAAGLQ